MSGEPQLVITEPQPLVDDPNEDLTQDARRKGRLVKKRKTSERASKYLGLDFHDEISSRGLWIGYRGLFLLDWDAIKRETGFFLAGYDSSMRRLRALGFSTIDIPSELDPQLVEIKNRRRCVLKFNRRKDPESGLSLFRPEAPTVWEKWWEPASQSNSQQKSLELPNVLQPCEVDDLVRILSQWVPGLSNQPINNFQPDVFPPALEHDPILAFLAEMPEILNSEEDSVGTISATEPVDSVLFTLIDDAKPPLLSGLDYQVLFTTARILLPYDTGKQSKRLVKLASRFVSEMSPVLGGANVDGISPIAHVLCCILRQPIQVETERTIYTWPFDNAALETSAQFEQNLAQQGLTTELVELQESCVRAKLSGLILYYSPKAMSGQPHVDSFRFWDAFAV